MANGQPSDGLDAFISFVRDHKFEMLSYIDEGPVGAAHRTRPVWLRGSQSDSVLPGLLRNAQAAKASEDEVWLCHALWNLYKALRQDGTDEDIFPSS